MKRGTIRKFGRVRNQRKAFIRSLLVALITSGRITTTEARAKTLKVSAEKAVTLAKKQTIAARRLLVARVGEKAATSLFTDIAPRFTDRSGGYTRVLHLPRRSSDGARVALIEFVA